MATLGLGRPNAGKASSKHPRQSSGAYQLFDAKQVQTFKEAFNLIDQDSDGFISEPDLRGLLSSLGEPLRLVLLLSHRTFPTERHFGSAGQAPSPQLIKELLSSRPDGADPSMPGQEGKMNFTTFVTLMASHLSTLDTEPELLEAFGSFDEGNTGFVKVGELRECLKSGAGGMSDNEIDRLLHAPFVDRRGLFNYRLFCSTLRVTDGDDDGSAVPF
ncbi:SPOSA6832_02115, partial [Sporobolomyces salmonicolor]